MAEITHAAAKQFAKFIAARERHRVAKQAGRAVSKPDPIISKYRFCNVRRNDDRVTKWIHEHYLEKWRSEPRLWFALIVARLFNLPGTLSCIEKFVLPFKPESMREYLHERAERGNNFNAAYIVSTAGVKINKIDYVVDSILFPSWVQREEVAEFIADHETLNAVHQRLMELPGLASFMAAQVVADLKYANPDKWYDFYTFAASGPGSKRGLNRVLGRPIDARMGEGLFREELAELRERTQRLLPSMGLITAQDIQNCLCEYDKYERARTGEGRPKQLYTPKEN